MEELRAYLFISFYHLNYIDKLWVKFNHFIMSFKLKESSLEYFFSKISMKIAAGTNASNSKNMINWFQVDLYLLIFCNINDIHTLYIKLLLSKKHAGCQMMRNKFVLIETNCDFVQKQPPDVFCKKGILKNLANFTGKHLYWSLFLIYSCRPKPASFLKTDSNQVFSCKICEIFKNVLKSLNF